MSYTDLQQNLSLGCHLPKGCSLGWKGMNQNLSLLVRQPSWMGWSLFLGWREPWKSTWWGWCWQILDIASVDGVIGWMWCQWWRMCSAWELYRLQELVERLEEQVWVVRVEMVFLPHSTTDCAHTFPLWLCTSEMRSTGFCLVAIFFYSFNCLPKNSLDYNLSFLRLILICYIFQENGHSQM